MSIENDKTRDSLKQIKADYEKVLDSIAEVKRDADAEILPHLEKIERDGWANVIEIGEVQKKQNKIMRDQIERNTILGRMPKRENPRRMKIGNVWI